MSLKKETWRVSLGSNPAYRSAAKAGAWQRLLSVAVMHFWLKSVGTIGFTALFFTAYFYLVHHPAYPVRVVPITVVDRVIGFEPLALPIYLSLWVYLSLAPMLMKTRREIVAHGIWMAGLCCTGLAIFYFWPNAIPTTQVSWDRYPGMALLKGVDAAGNACPSLHVATAVYTAFRLSSLLPAIGFQRGASWVNALWCTCIVYSTVATKQHVAVDVVAGAALGLAFVCLFRSRILRLVRVTAAS